MLIIVFAQVIPVHIADFSISFFLVVLIYIHVEYDIFHVIVVYVYTFVSYLPFKHELLPRSLRLGFYVSM